MYEIIIPSSPLLSINKICRYLLTYPHYLAVSFTFIIGSAQFYIVYSTRIADLGVDSSSLTKTLNWILAKII